MIALIKFAMCTTMPRRGDLPGLDETDIDGFLLRMRREADAMYWLGLVVGAIVFALTPILTVGVPLPAFLLPERLLARHSARILAHPIYVLRQAVFLVRLSAGMCWGADPKVREVFALAPYPVDAGTFRES